MDFKEFLVYLNNAHHFEFYIDLFLSREESLGIPLKILPGEKDYAL